MSLIQYRYFLLSLSLRIIIFLHYSMQGLDSLVIVGQKWKSSRKYSDCKLQLTSQNRKNFTLKGQQGLTGKLNFLNTFRFWKIENKKNYPEFKI